MARSKADRSKTDQLGLFGQPAAAPRAATGSRRGGDVDRATSARGSDEDAAPAGAPSELPAAPEGEAEPELQASGGEQGEGGATADRDPFAATPEVGGALPSPARASPPTPRRPPAPHQPEILSVARLDHLIRRVVESATTNVLVRGEVSGLHHAGSGHLYFTLKDPREDALIDCVMYRTAPAEARRALAEGERVVLSGRVTLYAPRGRLQLIADNVLQTERGALLEALERLKKKLAAEGLFAPENKQPLPRDPRRIAVLTSRTGAAIHDVIRVASRRGRVRLLLVPTPVQGFGAAERIARAIAFTDRVGVDAILVTRGGGSAEDLAAYNDEQVVRAIAACRTPVVSAVGHEIDVSLADLVADARAATPSQAAEILVPDDRERRATLEHLGMRLCRAMRHRIVSGRERAARLAAAIEEPRRRLLEASQRFDELSARMLRAMARRLGGRRAAVEAGARRLTALHPRRVTAEARRTFVRLEPRLAASVRERLVTERRRLSELEPRLGTTLRERLVAERHLLATLEPRLSGAIARSHNDARSTLERAAARLSALSPLSVLARGYAIATTAEGRVVMSTAELAPGDRLRVRLHEGELEATIDDLSR